MTSGPGTVLRQGGDHLSQDRVLEVVAKTARWLDADQPQLVREMSDLLARLIELLVASVEGNTNTIIHILANDIPVGICDRPRLRCSTPCGWFTPIDFENGLSITLA